MPSKPPPLTPDEMTLEVHEEVVESLEGFGREGRPPGSDPSSEEWLAAEQVEREVAEKQAQLAELRRETEEKKRRIAELEAELERLRNSSTT